MIGGVVNLNGSGTLGSGWRRNLRVALSRYADEEIHEFNLPNAYFVRANTGSLASYPGIIERGPDEVCLMAGEPLLSERGAHSDHRTLNDALGRKDLGAFRAARGLFCGVRYSATPNPVVELYGDKLGLRPLYYSVHGEVLVLASALRILKGLSFIEMKRDDLGVAQRITFGYPLSKRTLHEGIQVLRGAEIVRISRAGAESDCYWRWDEVSEIEATDEEARQEALRVFREAIRIRLRGGGEKATAFLSGGMDSRAIVSLLVDMGMEVRTFNFSLNESQQDHVLARKFAERVGCSFESIQLEEWPAPGTTIALNLQLRNAISKGLVADPGPGAIWTGDGGSVGVGSCHLDESVVELMRSGKSSEALEHFLSFNQMGFPSRIMQRKPRLEFPRALNRNVRSEISLYSCPDPAQNFLLFLMANDQRRLMADDVEDLDLHRFEDQLPFFDSKFLEQIFSLPLDSRLYHRFYSDWYREFPSAVRDVPYQTYPDHQPCPLPMPRGLSYQWERRSHSFPTRTRQRMSNGLIGLRLLLSRTDLGPISKPRFFAASCAQLLGIEDYEHFVNVAKEWARAQSDH